MKKGPVVAIAILVLLIGAYFATRKKVIKKVDSPYTIAAIDKVMRVEISKPDGDLIVLENADGRWRITKPINVSVSDFHAKKMDAIFGKRISMDDLLLSKEKLSDYDLSKDRAYKVSLFTKDAPAPSAEFYVGKESSVKTGERRSYIKTLGGEPYRAKSEISAIVRAPISNLRSKLIFSAVGKPTSISIAPREGIPSKFELLENKWEMTLPKKENFEVDPIQVRQLVGAFTKISANGFGDGKTDKEMDLDPPRSIVTAKVGEETVRYEIGNPVKKIFYIRIVGEKQAYKITKGPGRVLAGDFLIFKNRVEKTIPLEEVIAFQLAGKEKLKIVKRKTKWFSGKTELDATKIAPLLGTFTKMRAVKWKHVTILDAGLDPPDARVILKTKDGSYSFDIGKVFKKDNSRYARWSDSQYPMEVPYFIWDRATTGLETLKLKETK